MDMLNTGSQLLQYRCLARIRMVVHEETVRCDVRGAAGWRLGVLAWCLLWTQHHFQQAITTS